MTVGQQQRDGTSEVRGRIDPETRGLWDAVSAKWAAPGMCNPEDQNPCIDGAPSPDNVSGDRRSTGQRNHDALKAVLRAMLASGQLGSQGLPVTMVISTTLEELESGRGHAVTGGGTLLAMSQVIRQAAAAHHYWRCSTTTPKNPCIWAGRNDSPPAGSGSCSTPPTAAGRSSR